MFTNLLSRQICGKNLQRVTGLADRVVGILPGHQIQYTQTSRGISTTPVLEDNRMIRRDKHRRKCVAEHEGERLRLRAIVRNKLLPETIQQRAKQALADQVRDASITRVRNRCVLTGRPRGVVREYGLCRMKFRKLADFGNVSGLTRSTW